MTNIQALGKLLRKYSDFKPKMQDRMITLAKNRPLTACVQVMAELQRHVSKKFLDEMLPAYDALQADMLTDEKLTVLQTDEMMVALVTK
jgi:ribosomal protein L17